MTLKRKVYRLLEVAGKKYSPSWWVDLFLIILILLNVLALVLESVVELQVAYAREFYYFELFSVVVFSIEYVLRLWSANANEKYRKPIVGNFKYSLTPLAIVDLLAVLPFYLPMVGIDLRVLRLFRTFRLLKIVRYTKAMSLISTVVKSKKEELYISLVFTLFLLLTASTVMYHVEHNAQPEVFASIPDTMWWGVSTLTTVGYGDIYPITPLGRFLGGFISLIGIGMFALPTGIIVSGFTEEFSKRKLHPENCPTCGKPFEE